MNTTCYLDLYNDSFRGTLNDTKISIKKTVYLGENWRHFRFETISTRKVFVFAEQYASLPVYLNLRAFRNSICWSNTQYTALTRGTESFLYCV